MSIAEHRSEIARRSRSNREVPFDINSANRSAAVNVPITHGMCVPRGQLFEAGSWAVQGLSKRSITAQTEGLNYWSDGSIRWLLTHFVADRVPPGRTACILVPRRSKDPAIAGQTQIRCTAAGIKVATQGVVSTGTRAAALSLAPSLNDTNGKPIPLVLRETTEHASHALFEEVSANYCVRERSEVELCITVQTWSAAGLIKVSCRLRNSGRAYHPGGLWDLGDKGSFTFSSLRLNVSDDFVSPRSRIYWKPDTDLQIRNSSPSTGITLEQRGSGGPAWRNGHHKDATGRNTVTKRGFVAQFENGTLRGHRSNPVVGFHAGDCHLTLAIPEFWQNFPTAVHCQNGVAAIDFFPELGTPHELQGGEQKTLVLWLSTRTDSSLSSLDWVYAPPRICQPHTWIHDAEVFTWLPRSFVGHNSPALPTTNGTSCASSDGSTTGGSTYASKPVNRFRTWLNNARSGRWSFSSRRDRTDEYGWRNFGDLHADHEQPHFDGWKTLASHYNNQFDLILGGILNLCVSGDAGWYDLFDPLARHVIDIDVYHTDKDRACFNGGLFWHTDHFVDAHTSTHRTYSRFNATESGAYGGGPSNEHNYTTGLLYYYFLTGNRDACDAVTSLADWVIAMDDGSRTIWGAFDSGPTGLASKTVSDDYHGPGRGVGNSINALLDGWILAGRQCYLRKAEELIYRVVHPDQDCDDLRLSDAEERWSYTVCLLSLGRYLCIKREAGQLDSAYAYVREVMKTYGTWMLHNEKPALQEPEKLKLPTVAWAAQEFRKANVLRIAASCVDNPSQAAAMRFKADELNDTAWDDFNSFGPIRYSARCLSIMLTEGLRDLYHRTETAEPFPCPSGDHCWQPWQMFISQKQRVKRLLKNPLRSAMAVSRLLHPKNLIQTIDAVRRQF